MQSMVLTFVGVSLLLTVVPGPDSLLVVRSGLRGRAQAIATGAGTALAALGWGVLAAIGLAVILERSAEVFTIVKLAGAAYLVFLGVYTLWFAGSAAAHAVEGDDAVVRPRSIRSAFGAGAIAGLLNPKTGMFYVAILPQLIPQHAPIFTSTMVFAFIDAVVVVIYFTFLASLAAKLLPYLRRPRVMRNAERATGISLIGLGAWAAFERA